MKIMLDLSPRRISELSKKFDFDFWQLRTPLTNYRLSEKPYGLDNGCFNEFKENAWFRLVDEAYEKRPVFVCLPDVVGDARRTLDLFSLYDLKLNGLPKCLVLQDGIANHSIPWDKIAAVFVGGTDKFKISPEAINACKTAKMLGKWVHVGRVNGISRAAQYVGIADSIDGSGLSKYEKQLSDMVNFLNGAEKKQNQEVLF